jgi:hypothetical protein
VAEHRRGPAGSTPKPISVRASAYSVRNSDGSATLGRSISPPNAGSDRLPNSSARTVAATGPGSARRHSSAAAR